MDKKNPRKKYVKIFQRVFYTNPYDSIQRQNQMLYLWSGNNKG